MSQRPAASSMPATPGPSGSDEDATVTYEFQDSSVPPQFHRSYVLTFDRQQARIVVDSYGEVLADQTVAMTAQAWDQVWSAVDEIGRLQVLEPDQGCTGGTGFVVKVDRGGQGIVDLDGYACGGVNSEVSDQVSQWVSPVRSLFPPMSELAPEGNDE